jgi:spore maturation protein CgeB
VFLQAGRDALWVALWHDVFRGGLDAVLVVSGMFVHPDILRVMKRVNLPVFVVFTEGPYDLEKELAVAKLADGCWTNERSVVTAFQAVNPHSGYLPHAWHAERHRPGLQPGDEAIAAHDVVFVGSAFQERVAWLSAIDWTGIDLGLYGSWESLGSRHPLRRYVRGAQTDNATTAALYRRAKIGLNLYRTSMGWGKQAPSIAHAESLNPRAYELAACGAFHLSTYRQEVPEVFGDLVPTFTEPAEAEGLLRTWLANPDGRARVAAQLPACVAESSWRTRATAVIGDLQSLLQRRAA